MRYVTVRLLAAFCVLAVVACEQEPVGPPVVVYASSGDDTTLQSWLEEFTDSTGIPVTVVDGASGANTDAVISNRGTPSADILLTDNVADIWRAAEEGALRPIQSERLSAVPGVLRDPDGLWVALEYRYAAIKVAPRIAVAQASNYAELAALELRDEVCLSSSELAVNRALIAMLIQDMGVKPAERIVRGWMQNLAAPPFSTEAELEAAIDSGSCGYGIVSTTSRADGEFYLDIDGIGVARHARQADAAQTLVDWMLKEKALPAPVASNGKNVGISGWRDRDARLLVERAGYR